jgi:hypothetical protein
MPTYPNPNPSFKIVEAGYLSLLSAIGYLAANSGGTLTAVADPKMALDLEQYISPAMVLAFAREDVTSHKTENVGGAFFETMMFWDLYVISSSFSPEGEGRLQGAEMALNTFDPGAYAMVNDALTALNGKPIPSSPVQSKAFIETPVAVLHRATENRVVYRMRFRNQWQRAGI